MTLKTIERPAAAIVGMKIVTLPMSPEIPALWPRFVARIEEIQGRSEPAVTYGVMQGDEKSLRYMAGVASTAARAPAGMETWTLPAGTYATFRYPLSGLGKGFDEIFSELLPKSGYAQVPGPLFERYDESFDPKNPQSQVEIGVPVKLRGKS